MAAPVPGPPGWPFIGNALDLRTGEFPLMALNTLADEYGPIYQFSVLGHTRVVVSSQKLVNELCDEKKFAKRGGGFAELKGTGPAGLFFAKNEDPNWGLAHRILTPAFGPLSVLNMFDEMHDISKQLALSWARKGPYHRIDATGDFTRLTLDTIALCAMGYRFNSFYQEQQHPYVEAMNTYLGALSKRTSQLPVIGNLLGNHEAKAQEAREVMLRIARELVDARRNHPNDKKDLLNAMMNGVDPRTGQKMEDGLIMANMNTFLIAGHETTAGLLGFVVYSLLKNPSAYKAAQAEVDRVLGGGAVKPHHLKEFKYLNAVLRETLRLYPTAPAFTLKYKGSDPVFTIGDYFVEGSPAIMVLLQKLHRDPAIYGDDAELFKPERMSDERFEKLPPNSWKPFGNGMRGCIGRSFAWQEALLALAILLQRFDLQLDDPKYEIQYKFNLTIKPRGMFIRATIRNGLDATELELAMNSGIEDFKIKKAVAPVTKGNDNKGQRLTILYGSNTGTCEALAQKLLADAGLNGFAAESAPLDSAAGNLASKGPFVIIVPSYEGQPPDNAIHFVEWLEGLTGKELEGSSYAVFGCGHHDWHDTFHRIPKLIDELICSRGGKRITPLGTCDVAESDFMDIFDTWKDRSFWPSISQPTDIDAPTSEESIQHSLEIEVSADRRANALRQDVSQAVVLDANVLTQPGEPEKRHLELQLPDGVTYKAGDYLAVLPLNPTVTVRRVMKRYGLPWDASVKLKAENNPTSLPAGMWIGVHQILKGYVELSQPPSKKDIRRFISLTTDPAHVTALQSLLASPPQMPPLSTLDLLEKYPSIDLPFASFLSLLPPIRIRLYSISSSPLLSPSKCTISYAVFNGMQDGKRGNSCAYHPHPGVASTYLASLCEGDRVHVAVKPSRAGFHLPPPPPPTASAPPPTPIVMICAGTGVAPFRAFVQERALQLAKNNDYSIGPALLFIGCRSPGRDTLYSDELAQWQASGALQPENGVRYAFSRARHQSGGCGYVQERVRRDAADVRALWDAGAKVFVCGGSAMAREVAAVLRSVLFGSSISSSGVGDGDGDGDGDSDGDGDGTVNNVTKEEMEGWADALKAGRIVTDIFG